MTKEQAESFIRALDAYIATPGRSDVREHLRNVLMGIDAPVPVTELVAPSAIIERTARAFGINQASMFARNRHPSTVRPKQVAMLLLRERGMSYPEIARTMGYSDHTTAMSGVTTIVRLMVKDERLKDIVESLRRTLRSAA